MSRGGGFRKKGRKTPEENYIAWRISEGFTKEEAKSLYENLDGTEIGLSQSKVFATAVYSLETDMLLGIHALDQALLDLGRRIPPHGLVFAEHWNRIHTSLTLAATGNYQIGTIVLRNCIEGFLRSNFQLLNNFVDGGEFEELSALVDWDKAISLDSKQALAIGPMCKILDKSKLVKPIKNCYYHMKIDVLNSITHANLATREHAEDNFLAKGNLVREYNEQHQTDYNNTLNRFVEMQLILFQNILDRISYYPKPVLPLGFFHSDEGFAHDSKTFPKYAKLVKARTKNNRKGCDFCWQLTKEEMGPNDLSPLDWKKLRKTSTKIEFQKLEEKMIKRNRAIADKKMSALERARIEPGKRLQRCSKGCAENWRLLNFEPGLAANKFSSSDGKYQILSTESDSDCDNCEGRGVTITDCSCGYGCSCGESGKHVFFFAASSKQGMFGQLAQMQAPLLESDNIHLPGMVAKPEDVKVGKGKNLIKTKCGCAEDWIVVWREGKANLIRNSKGSSVNYKSCRTCGKLGVKIVDCICRNS